MFWFCRKSQKQLYLVVVTIFTLLSNPVWANNRVALVVGNSDYGYDSLKNPINDAKAIERVLDNIGFNVISVFDANKTKFDDALYQFGEAAELADIAIVYYAGHAIEVDGRNYLMPTGVKLKKRRDLKKLIDMQEFVEEAGLAKTLGLVIIDACRDNPFAKKLQRTLGRSVSGRGLARVNTSAGSNTLVAFATEAGQLAQDGSGANSPYAKALINNLSRKNTDVRQVFGYVRDDVMSETQQSQQPYTYGSLSGQAIYLAGKGSEQSSGVGRLTIKVEPEDAKIRIMNIGPKYRTGMALAMGKSYDIYITREGYKAYREPLLLSEQDQIVGVVLNKISSAAIQNPTKQQQWFEPEMVVVPEGSFRMGDVRGKGVLDEKPVHRVTVPVFMLSRYEVTLGQYRAFVESSGYRKDVKSVVGGDRGCRTWMEGLGRWDWQEGNSWQSAGFEQSDKHPVVCVSWNDTQAYIKWLNKQTSASYRLPSESEWEYAARAGLTAKYSFGSIDDELCGYANVADKTKSPNGKSWSNRAECSDGYWFTAPVGSYKENDFGLNDLHGNVREWVEDQWHSNYKGAPSDGSVWEAGNSRRRVLRGGGWSVLPSGVRSASRSWNDEDNRNGFTGFRLAQDR